MTTVYPIEGMHCGACVKRVTAALSALDAGVTVTLTPPQAVMASAVTPSRAMVENALATAGSFRLAPEVAAVTPADPLAAAPAVTTGIAPYYPLFLIVGYIAVCSFAGVTVAGSRAISWQTWMANFMAGFFLVFSFFKLLDIRGFADAYSGYDLLAKRWHPWGLIYPFVELVLGLAFLFRVAPIATNTATVALMLFGSLGVLDALRQRRTIRCACLGTVLNLPMSTITLVEDLGMAAMALMALAAHGTV